MRLAVSNSHRTVLVVDDDPGIREALALIFEFEGWEVTCAANGIEALRAVDQSLPSLILLDLQMPVLDGAGFARALRERGVHIPTVLITASPDEGEVAAAIGADASLAKPFDMQPLVNLAKSLIRDTLAAEAVGTV